MQYTVIQTKHMGEDVSSSSFSGSLDSLVSDFEDVLDNQSIETISELMDALRASNDGYSYLLK